MQPIGFLVIFGCLVAPIFPFLQLAQDYPNAPIIGQDFGAGNTDRVRRGFNAAVIFVAVVIVLVSALLFMLRAPIADLFGAYGLTRDLIYLFCGPLALAFFFPGVLFCANAAFNNLGQPFLSTFTNWGRNAVALIPLVYLGSWTFGAQGVLIGQALAGVLFGIIAWVMALRVIERSGDAPRPKKELFGREGRLMTLFHARR
ncbi:MAG: MATE family efflux transporter [Sulfitobacter sp.]